EVGQDEIVALPDSDVDVPITLSNAGLASECTITAIELPKGVAFETLGPVKLAKGEKRQAYLGFHMKTDASPGGEMKYCRLGFVNGDAKYELWVPITVYSPWLQYEIHMATREKGDSNGAKPAQTVDGTLDIRRDGWVR